MVFIFWNDLLLFGLVMKSAEILSIMFLAWSSSVVSMKIEVHWPFLNYVALDKLEHIRIIAHHGRITGQIVIERRGLAEENKVQDLLAYCDLQIVLVTYIYLLKYSILPAKRSKFYFISSRELDDKPALLDSLQQKNYPIYEVKFETMLDIVEACSHLQIQRNSLLTSPFNKTNTAVNMWSLLKGMNAFTYTTKISVQNPVLHLIQFTFFIVVLHI